MSGDARGAGTGRTPRSARIGWILAGSGLAIVLSAGFGLYGIENVRGRKALEEAYSAATVDPWPEGYGREPEIRDEDNVFAAPILACLNAFEVGSGNNIRDALVFHDLSGVERLRAVSLPSRDVMRYGYFPKLIPEAEPESSGTETPADLVVWAALLRRAEGFEVPDRSANHSRQILAATEGRFGAELAELTEAAKRPCSLARSVLVEDGPFAGELVFPHFGELIGLLRLLSLREAAAIDIGDGAVFRDSFAVHLRLIEGMLADPYGRSEIIVLTEVPLLLRVAEFGLSRGRWTAAELAALQGQLGTLPLPESIEASYRVGIENTKRRFEAIRTRRELADRLFWSSGDAVVRLRLARMVPDGWIDLNAAELISWTHSAGIIPWQRLDFASLTGSGASPTDFTKPETFLLSETLYPDADTSKRLVLVYLEWEMAQIACALEAHRLVHGVYPDSLGSLNIEIPRDPFGKEPLRYFTEGTGYRLYSVGWNRRDDFGAVVRNDRGRRDLEIGDWVWGEGDLPGERLVVNRKKALVHIRMEEERGAPLNAEEFEKIWSEQTVEKSDPVAEEIRRARLIQRVRERMEKDAKSSDG